MTPCPTCDELVHRRAVSALADHLEQRHKTNFGVRRLASKMVFGTVGTKE